MADGSTSTYGPSSIESLEPLLHGLRSRDRRGARRSGAAWPASRRSPKIARVTMKPSWTVMAAFEERVAARFDAAFVNGSALGWIARNTSKPKRDWKIDTWVLQAHRAWSQAHLDDRPGRCRRVPDGSVRGSDSGRPAARVLSRRCIAGATPPPIRRSPSARFTTPESRITLCGDWCKGSRIEDAYLSGLEAAMPIGVTKPELA